MKVKQIQLAEYWSGSSVYRLLHLKGDTSRFMITKQSPMASDSRTHRIKMETTCRAIMKHWNEILPNKYDDLDGELQLV